MLGGKLPPRGAGQGQGHRRAFSEGAGQLMRVRADVPEAAGFEPLPSYDGAEATQPDTPPEEPPDRGAGGSPSRSRPRHRTAHERACAAIALPRAVALSLLALLAACCIAIPVTFDEALSGDALWSSFAAPGEYLNVEVVSAQGLPPRPVAGPHGADTDVGAVPAGDYGAPDATSTLRNPYIYARTWPPTRDVYRTRTANATLSPVFQQEFTFDQGLARSRRISLQLFDQGPRGTPPLWLGTAMVPVPGPEAQPVAADVRASGRPDVDIIEGWFPFFARAEGDYDGIPPPAVAEVYARVSFAKRRANSGYCEEVRLENPIAQPMDSYSNVAFIITGLHMLGVGALDTWRMAATRRMSGSGLPLTVPDQYALPGVGAGPNPYAALSQMEQFPVYSVANGLVQFYAGLSSFLFHASMTALGQRLDMAGVYMLVVSPSLYMLLRLGAFGPPSSRAAHAAFAAATAVAAFAFYKYKWQLERYTGGSTNLVLDLVAIMATLIALWLWALGSPGQGDAAAKRGRGGEGGSAQGGSESNGVASPHAASGSDDGASAGTTPRGGAARNGDGTDAAGATGQPDSWLPGLMSLRPLSARGAAGGYEALRSSDGGSNGSSPTAAGTSASISPRSPPSSLSPGPASPGARDGTSMLRQLLGAGSNAWRHRRLPRALSYRYCVLSVMAIVVAYASREADVKYDLWCMPRSWFQLHSVWHVMAALSLWSLWVFMRSEAPAGSVTREMKLPQLPPLPPLRIFGKKARTSSAPIGADGIEGAAPAGSGAMSPRATSLAALAGAGIELIAGPAPVQPLSARAASIPDDSAPVGVTAAQGRAAMHLRTRSREVFNLSDGRDMV